MQVWVPYPNFLESAKSLDDERLGRQRIHCQRILTQLRTKSNKRYSRVIQMWKGFEPCLCLYAMTICAEYAKRGNSDILYTWFKSQYSAEEILSGGAPFWWGDERIHGSHRGKLLIQDPEWYSQYGWTDIMTNKTIYAQDLVH